MEHAALQIKDLDLLVNIGWTEQERSEKQTIKVTLDIKFPKTPPACTSDDLKDTFCYATLIASIIEFIQQKEFKLLEHFGKELHHLVKETIGKHHHVVVTAIKHPAIRDFSGDINFQFGDQ